MKKSIFLLIFCYCFFGLDVFAQTENDPIPIVSWKISERLGNITPTPFDTIVRNYQNRNITDGFSTVYQYTGNLMLPGQSGIFFDRPEQDQFIFIDAYRNFIKSPGNFNFTNTKIPYSNLSYRVAGGSTNKEERFDGMFTANVDKKWNVGLNFDYIYAKGFYQGQAAKQFDLVFFSNYLSDKYVMHTFWGIDNINHYENGGIKDDRYITNPEAVTGSKRPTGSRDVPVWFTDEGVRLKNRQFYLTQRYNVGYYRKISEIPDSAFVPVNKIDELTSNLQVKGKIYQNETDSVGEVFNPTAKTEEFVPVTSFIYTAKYTYDSRHFTAKSIPSGYYPDPITNSSYAADSTYYRSLRNTFGIALLEGFNKYAKAGLSVFIENEIRSFRLMNGITTGSTMSYFFMPTSDIRHTENTTTVGAELTKTHGSLLTYDFRGELGILGDEMGGFKISGNILTQFRLRKDTVSLKAYGFLKNLVPSYYLNAYHSDFYWWNNDFSNQRRVRLGGVFSIPTRGFSLDVGVENMQNYIYFDERALPVQTSSNVQIFSARLNQNFRFGILNWENELVYQTSSNKDILPLPEFSVYSNLYLWFKFVKVMNMQIGADVRYFTGYYAPNYQPATTQFYLQGDDKITVGNYPLVNIYANMYLKKTRFFIMAYNVAQKNYFSLPHYPLNPFHVRMGLSVSFND